MKKVIYVFFASVLSLSGCGDAAGDFEFTVSPDTAQVIKSSAISCVSRKNAGTDAPTYDITANFAQFRGLTFKFVSTEKALVINTLEFKFEGMSTLTVAADALLALNSVWWGAQEAVVGGPIDRPKYSNPLLKYSPAAEVKIDCALYLGSLPGGNAYSKSGSVTAYGHFEDAAGNIEPAQAMGFATITWRGD